MPLARVLVANRGEIAVRVIRACHALGIEAVVAVSEADRDSLPARLADRAVRIGPPPPSQSYLRVEAVVAAALGTGCDGLHPGYGFLAEAPALAEACAEQGLTFVGPRADSLRQMGHKLAARALAAEHDVPTAPGSTRVRSAAEAAAVADEIGYPVIVKAAAGGGGRGIKVVNEAAALAETLAIAAAEARAAFGDDALYLERYVARARHVEVQVLGDGRGQVIHLGERDCSLQRRYQKIVEEGPATFVAEAARDTMRAAAVRLAAAIDYASAGTMEFLYDQDTQAVYFLEMNTRIQVEHPVTEMITGADLVQAQLRIAGGEPLPYAQADVRLQGHAIECRITAESAAHDFRPSPGTITRWDAPSGTGVRLDTHCYAGYRVPPYYDSLLAKLIVHGADRTEALARLRLALAGFTVEGIDTTLPFLRALVSDPAFVAGQVSTRWVEERLAAGAPALGGELTAIYFADTTIRDGHSSLWAQNMRTGMILAIARDLDRAGFTSIELMYPPPKKVVRELKEDPWERLRLVRERITETPLRTIVGPFPAFDYSPPILQTLKMQCEGRAGIRQARISSEWNQVESWAWKMQAARDAGLDPIVNVIYSDSPRHTDAYYAERAQQLAALRPFRICLKDPGGLLTPERTRALAPIVLAAAGDIPVELHSHCTTGLGPLNALEAVRCGIYTVNVGVPPLANGAALPNVFNVAANVRALGYEPVFNADAVRAASATLTTIAEREGLPIGRPVEYDGAQYQHQVPGGMISNLRHQLKLVGMEHRVEQTLEEAARVREEWGWPIMVTPLSQFVGSQAAINVITGERYKEVTDQVILYALGYWGGDEAIEAMQPDVRDRILARPRAQQIIADPPHEPTYEELRARYAAPGVSDEEMLLRMECSDSELAALRAAGSPRRYEHLDAGSPLVTLVEQLTKRTDRAFIHVQKGDLTLTLFRHEPAVSPA